MAQLTLEPSSLRVAGKIYFCHAKMIVQANPVDQLRKSIMREENY